MAERQLTLEETEALVEFLGKVPLFAELRTSDLRALTPIVQTDVYPAGAVIYHQSDADNTLYIILKGEVALVHIDPQGAPQDAGLRGVGVGLGESSLLLGEPHDVTARAVKETTVITFERAAFKALSDSTPGLMARLTPNEDNARKINAPHFGWQAEDESVIVFVRQHSWSMIRSLLIPGALLVVAIIIIAIIGLNTLVGIVFGILAVLSLLAFSFYLFLNWENDYYVVTNKRLVHVDEIPYVRTKREEAPLTSVTEIQFARNSILAHLFDFGDLRVETFSGFVGMQDIPHPVRVKNLIQREIERVKARARASERNAIRDELRQRVLAHEDLPAAEVSPVETPVPPPSPFAVFTGVIRYFFPQLEEHQGDTIIWRKHWIVLWQTSIWPFLGMVLIGLFTLDWWENWFPFGGLSGSLWWIWLVLFLGFFVWWLWLFEDWRNDQYIITSTRVIDIERIPFLLSEKRREANLSRIQTTEIKIPTPLARSLGYGDLTIRVPGGAIEFKFIKNPTAAQAEVTKRMANFARIQAENEARGRRTELSDWFAVYDQIQKSRPAPAAPLNSPEEQIENDSP